MTDTKPSWGLQGASCSTRSVHQRRGAEWGAPGISPPHVFPGPSVVRVELLCAALLCISCDGTLRSGAKDGLDDAAPAADRSSTEGPWGLDTLQTDAGLLDAARQDVGQDAGLLDATTHKDAGSLDLVKPPDSQPADAFVPGCPIAGYPILQNGAYYSTLCVPASKLPWKASKTLLWNQALPSSTPLAANSAAIVAKTVALASTSGPYGGACIETRGNAPAVFVVDSSVVPLKVVAPACGNNNWPGTDLSSHINSGYAGQNGVPIPPNVHVSTANAGGDAPLAIYDWKADIQFNFWIFDSSNNSTCWAGRLSNFTNSDGRFPYPYGEDMVGFTDLGTNITMDDIASGAINHVIAISVPHAIGNAAPGNFSYPATRGGGGYSGTDGLYGGQRMRLPASYDTSALSNPVLKMIAEAAKKYGLINHDFGGCVSFQFESDLSVTGIGKPSPWDTLLAGLDPHQFPWDKLEVLPKDWGKP